MGIGVPEFYWGLGLYSLCDLKMKLVQLLRTLGFFPGDFGNFLKIWAKLIRMVYEVDPLACPRCGGTMKIVAFILKTKDIENILWPLKIDEEDDQPRGPPRWLQALEAKHYIEQNSQLYPEEKDFDDLAQVEVPIDAYFQDPIWE